MTRSDNFDVQSWAHPLIKDLCCSIDGNCNMIVTSRVKESLVRFVDSSGFRIPKCFQSSSEACYSRRLIYEDTRAKFVVVAMTWGPGQGTPIHDHGGEWCVEAVAQGQIEVTQFELTGERNGLFSFVERERTLAGRGSSGALIPPFEYHQIANPSKEDLAMTIHVYARSLDCCGTFEPAGDGLYRKVIKDLRYQPYLNN